VTTISTDEIENNKIIPPRLLISIDPGSSKSGLAVMDMDKNVLEKKIVLTSQIEKELRSCIEGYKPDIIIMGNGTWSKRVRPRVEQAAGDIPLLLVDETHSTERAKLRYFKENPPRGLWRLVPVTLQVPKVPIDDYAAIILAEDYLGELRKTGNNLRSEGTM
jgi:hypothetical protein